AAPVVPAQMPVPTTAAVTTPSMAADHRPRRVRLPTRVAFIVSAPCLTRRVMDVPSAFTLRRATGGHIRPSQRRSCDPRHPFEIVRTDDASPAGVPYHES